MPMLKLLAALVLAIPLLAGIPERAFAGEAAAPRLGDRIMDYYRQPDARAALGWLAEIEPAALATPQALDLVALFYAHVLRAHPELTESFAESLRQPRLHAQVVLAGATAIWLAGSPDRDLLVTRLAAEGRIAGERLQPLRSFPVFDKDRLHAGSPHELDLCWISFFATGDGDYVEKVAEALPHLLPPALMEELANRKEPEARIAFERSLMAGAATWSLLANAERHPAVAARVATIAEARQDRVGAAAAILLQRLKR